jgi:hypothetical protein
VSARQAAAPAGLAALLAAAVVTAAVALAACGPRGESEDAAAASPDDAGMEPRIVTEGPVDAPGRPAEDGPDAAVFRPAEEPPAAAWVPHLPAADLDATAGFYEGLGFVVAAESGEGEGRRVEMERGGARLVLVAAPAPTTSAEDAEGEASPPADAAPPPVELHLLAPGDDGPTRTARDPDGRRVTVPGEG